MVGKRQTARFVGMAAGEHHKLEMGNRTCMDVEDGSPGRPRCWPVIATHLRVILG